MKNITKKEIQAIKKIAVKKSVLPILNNALILDNKLIITNLDNYLIFDNWNAENHLLPIDKLVKLQNIQDVIINDSVNYITDKIKVKFKKLNITEFPETPECNYKSNGKLSINDIKNLYDNRIFISTDELKPALNFYQIKDNYSEASTGYVLKRFNLDSNFNKFYMNKKCIEILNIFKNECKIYTSDKWVKYQFDNFCLISRNLTDNFPDFNSVIPSNFVGAAEIDKLEFINAINDISDYTNKEKKEIRLNINGKFELEAIDSENNYSAETKINSINSGENVLLGFNYQYLLQILKSCNNDKLELKFNNSYSAAVINDNSNNINLIMPIRI